MSTPIVTLIENVVDELRETATIASQAQSGTVMTLTVSNTLTDGEVVTMFSTGAVDEGDFIISSVSSSEFSITASGFTAESYKALAPYYLHGHPLNDITNVLAEKSDDGVFKFQKYPLIALLQDFDEAKNFEGFEAEVELNLIIATETDQSFHASDRYTNIFVPTLYPLYDDFIDEIIASTQFDSDKPIHTKIDRVRWGREGVYGSEANIFNDHIDAIEIQNLELKILKTC